MVIMMCCSSLRTNELFILSIIFTPVFPIFSEIRLESSEEEGMKGILKEISFGHMGGYVSSSFCPQNERSYVSGARIRLSSFLNQTFPTVNAIELVCSDGIQPTVVADDVLLLQKNIGNWTEIKECPLGGFVTGITLYMQLVSVHLVAGENVKSVVRENRVADPSRFLDLFELGRNTYISGLTMNCTFNKEEDDFDWDGMEHGDNVTNPVMKRLWRNTVTLGRPSAMGMRLFCVDQRTMTGISMTMEAMITYEDGERWIPTDVSTKCRMIKNPVKTCFPELEWEKINVLDKTCINAETGKEVTSKNTSGGESINVTCQVAHNVGLTPNKGIENLGKILRAYQPVNLEGFETRMFLRAKLYSYHFKMDWQEKYKLSEEEYFRTVLEKPETTYFYLAQDTHQAHFKNVNFKEPEYSKLIRNAKTEPLEYEFSVKQLVGYCSIYKIYFPLFRNEFLPYFERKIAGIKSKINFPVVLDSSMIKEAIEAKLGMKLDF